MQKKDRDPREDLIFSLGIGIVVAMVMVVLNIFTYTAKAATVPGNDSSVSQNVASEHTVVSSNYTSSNTLSGPMTYDQGDRIIHLLYLVIFMLVFAWCHERIRNGIRSVKKTF